MPPKLKGVVPTLYEMPKHEKKKKHDWALIWIVIFFIAKAEILFTIVAVAAGNAAAHLLPQFYLKQLISLITQRRIFDQDILNDSILWVMLLVAALYIIVGLGILLRMSWSWLLTIMITIAEMVGLSTLMIRPAFELNSQVQTSSQVFLVIILLADLTTILAMFHRTAAFESRNYHIFGSSK
jgi:hypothetical protein